MNWLIGNALALALMPPGFVLYQLQFAIARWR